MALAEIRQHEFSPMPATLNDARIAVRNLPGAKNYISRDIIHGPEIDKRIDILVSETLKELDAENMMPLIANNLGWSDEEAYEFFSHPARQPYRSKMEFSTDSGERAEQFLTIGTYLLMLYKNVRETADNDADVLKAADLLRNFQDFAVYNLFQQDVLDFTDEANGISPDDRHAGILKPGFSTLALLEESAKAIALKEEKDWHEVYNNALAATEGGNLQTAFSFIMNRNGDPAVRNTLQLAIERQVDNYENQIRKIKLLWSIDSFRLRMGIDWETYLEIGNLPNSQIIKDRLINFLSRQDLTEEVMEHLKREAPVSAKKIEDGGVANYWDALTERAAYHKLPDQIDSPEELAEKKERVWNKLRSILPLAFDDTPTNFIDAPVRMGASLRASNTTYYNTSGELVNVVILDPRDKEDHFEEVTGHELGHKLHARMLIAAEEAGYLPQGSNERVPSSVKEEFSQLVENQIGMINSSDKKEEVGDDGSDTKSQGEFRDLVHAVVYRRQAPYALIQQEVRLEMEKLWNQGNQLWDLSEGQSRKIIETVKPMADKWYHEGVPLYFPYHRVHTNINLLAPDDGLVYVRKQLSDGISQEPVSVLSETNIGKPKDMKAAFEYRFGGKWILDKNARKVLLGLLAETGKNYNILTYGDYVLNADVDQISNQLQEWGIDSEKV